MKIDNWKIFNRLSLAVYVKRFLLSIRKKSVIENFVD